MCLGTGVPKVTQSLHVCKAMCLGTRVSKAKGMSKGHKVYMSQDDMPRHEGAKGDTKFACLHDNVVRHGGAEGKGMPKTQNLHVTRRCAWAQGCRRHKTCMSQGDVPRHEGAECDIKLACRNAMWLGKGVHKAQSLHVARRCG
ncbi:unnamed protein product [Prunus armeniaca]